MDVLKEIKEIAYKKYGDVTIKGSDPINMLYKVIWNIPQGDVISSETMAMWNLELDERSCLGRLAKAAVLVENFFPEASVSAAEVLQDFLRDKMLEVIKSTENPSYEMLQEVLLYEEPHSVIQVNGEQFDPLSCVYPGEIIHPQVQTFPVWEYIKCSYLVSKANISTSIHEKFNILNEAEGFCPGSSLVMENKILPLVILGRDQEAIEILMKIVKRRPVARNLFVAGALTGDIQYHQQLLKGYNADIFNILLMEVHNEQQKQNG